MNYNNPETKPRKPRKKRTHFPLGSHRGEKPLPLYFSEMRYISADDWKILFEEYEERFLDDPKLTQRKFCEEKEISPKSFSANYSKHKPKIARRKFTWEERKALVDEFDRRCLLNPNQSAREFVLEKSIGCLRTFKLWRIELEKAANETGTELPVRRTVKKLDARPVDFFVMVADSSKHGIQLMTELFRDDRGRMIMHAKSLDNAIVLARLWQPYVMVVNNTLPWAESLESELLLYAESRQTRIVRYAIDPHVDLMRPATGTKSDPFVLNYRFDQGVSFVSAIDELFDRAESVAAFE